jgi:iron complex outermembrane receptor protein
MMQNIKIHFLTIFILISLTKVSAQKIEVVGKIIDEKSNIGLSFANLRIDQNNKGTASNKNGDYKLNTSAGTYTIIASYIGYISDSIRIDLQKIKLLIFL